MTTVLRSVFIMAAVAVAGCAGIGLRQDFPPAAAPKLAVGEQWSYRVLNAYNNLPLDTLTYEALSASADRTTVKVTRSSDRASFNRSYDAGGNPLSGEYPPGLPLGSFWNGIPPGAPVDYAPALPLYRFPLVSGGNWSGTVTAADAGAHHSTPLQVKAWVRGMSRITVPAGEFDTIEIQRDLYYQDNEWWRSGVWERQIDWYAPAANLLVRRSQRSQYTDYAQGLQRGGAPIMYGDYLITELVEAPAARR
ncbi:MAG TPA: hypothetical protein VLC55_12420 [Burkholderiales bacterium]|nr:hypothetical protein [Burkholderiales bacterium]